jgi:hypothetical protein
MREPDRYDLNGWAWFGRIAVNDSNFTLAKTFAWRAEIYSYEDALRSRDDLADAIAWYEARKAEGQ